MTTKKCSNQQCNVVSWRQSLKPKKNEKKFFIFVICQIDSDLLTSRIDENNIST
jgi:hypothetical protein